MYNVYLINLKGLRDFHTEDYPKYENLKRTCFKVNQVTIWIDKRLLKKRN